MRLSDLVRCAATASLVGVCSLLAGHSQSQHVELTSDCSAYASVPLPAEAEKAVLPKKPPACASYRSYRGIGRPTNYAQARACAWRERLAQKANLGQNETEPDAWVVGGSLILADIYINGAGVKPNIPLAMRLACEAEPAMVSIALPYLENFTRSPHSRGPFEFCDYAATTFTMDFCNGYSAAIKDERRNRFYSSLKSSMNPAQRSAFVHLMAARDAYVKAHWNEVDQGGTIRAIRTIGSEEILEDLFHTELVHFERKQWPSLSEKQITSADALMLREYNQKLRQLQSKSKEELEDGGVSAVGLSKVQTSWDQYRDAWAAFAKLRYPAEAPAIRAQVIFDRYRLLRTID